MLIKNKYFPVVFLLAFLINLFFSCGNDYVPKPRGYFRIDLPEKQYRLLDSIYPYTFEYPVYAQITPDKFAPDEPYWINIDFPQFKGRLHLSYKVVDNNLADYLEDARTMVVKHIPKASAINEKLIINEHDKTFGLIYEIKGIGAASPYQFFITDSTKHFLRGALYFNIVPNNDSLAPVIDFLKQDIEQMINTFKWKREVK